MGYTQRLVSRLSSSESEPQAQDSRTFWDFFSGSTSRAVPDSGSIEEYVEDYDDCPLVSTPLDNFASDVMAPGYRFESEDTDLAEDLQDFGEKAAIIAGEFNRDYGDLLEDQVRDKRLRGTGIAELAYADREQAQEIKGFRLFRAETTTAYTRPGQAILLRPDDDPEERSSNGTERKAPTTPAGKTAAYVQYDDIFGSAESDETVFAQDDVVKVSNKPDTGDVFGRSDVGPVHDRVRGLVQKLKDVDEAIAAKAYAFWLIRMGHDESTTESDIEQAKQFMAEQEAENYGPGKKQAVPNMVEIETVEGEVPEVWESFSFDVQYILSRLPTPKYRTGFEDSINRDVAMRQQEDYEDEVIRERRRLEAAWYPVWQRVAIQLGYGSAESPPEFDFLIQEEQDTNPLRQDWFDPSEFKTLMEGLAVGAPGGQVDMILPPEKLIEWFGGDPDELLNIVDESDALDEDDPEVQAAVDAIQETSPGEASAD